MSGRKISAASPADGIFVFQCAVDQFALSQGKSLHTDQLPSLCRVGFFRRYGNGFPGQIALHPFICQRKIQTVGKGFGRERHREGL